MSNVSDYDKQEALAEYLGVAVEDVKPWSDDSFTVGSDTHYDYKLTLRPSTYGTYQGRAGKYYVNKS